MQIPPIEQFRQNAGVPDNPAWWSDPEGAAFTLELPDGEAVWEDGGWEGRPHEASYQMAMQVLPEVESLKEKAVAFLARIVDFEKLALDGEPYVIGVHCDARTQKVDVELAWTEEAYVRFGVTFSWRMNHPQLPDFVWPNRMAFWNA